MTLSLNIDDSFSRELPADKDTSGTRRQVAGAAFSYISPAKFNAPELIHVSNEAAALIGLTPDDTPTKEFLDLFSGQAIYPGTRPYAMAYAGHQFGVWAGQLGDGRAVNLFEVVHNDKRWAAQLKGAGATPYSRNADGLAVLRSSIREHLCSEAMYHLGIPTTRSLSLIKTGHEVIRDMFYNGNPAAEPGAIVCRLSPSFVRFGNFEFFAARKEDENLKLLLDHVISHFYPEITSSGKEAYLDFFEILCNRTIDLILEWKRVGFVHGVMNTDNMSALGLTIDYGPYGWIDNYDEDWTPNTTDAQNRRYRFGQQDSIALWNLYQLANAIYPVINDVSTLQDILEKTEEQIPEKYYTMMLSKLGLTFLNRESILLIDRLRELLQSHETDMTIFFRSLSGLEPDTFEADEKSIMNLIGSALYSIPPGNTWMTGWIGWFGQYIALIRAEGRDKTERKSRMHAVNPKYVLRNYMAQMAIDDAYRGDYTLVHELFEMLKRPYDEQPQYEKWFALRPDWARTRAGCSMLSCSS